MQKLQQTLFDLDSVLRKKRIPIIRFLDNGINRSYLTELFRKFKIRFDPVEEIYSLFEWHNGINMGLIENDPHSDVDTDLFTLGIPCSIERSIDAYLKYSVENNFWPSNLFPLFESSGGDYFLIDLDKNSNESKKIFFFSPSNPYFQGTISKFDSLLCLIESIIECYEKDIYKLDDKAGELLIQPKLETEVFRKNNPLSEYWKVLQKGNFSTD
jgi:hypothetical protein